MIAKPLFKQTFSLLLLIGITDAFANTFYLYWTVWWIDIPLHFFAGVCVGMATVLVWQYYFDKNLSFKKSLVVSTILIIIIGIAWEVFEVYFAVVDPFEGMIYITDTVSDLVLDISGSLLGVAYGYRAMFNNSQNV